MQAVRGFILFLVLVYGSLAYGQSVMVGPDRKFEKGVIMERRPGGALLGQGPGGQN